LPNAHTWRGCQITDPPAPDLDDGRG